jgi:hypothetical protein
MSEHSRRAYYRIRYPIDDRPTLELGEERWEVVDVAEFGCGFLTRPGDAFHKGELVRGRLRIGTRHDLTIEGIVVWRRSDHAALKFNRPIPFKVVLDEQRYLKSRYKLRDLMGE